MNRYLCIGRLTSDPKMSHYSDANGDTKAIARFSLAVERKTKDRGADFPNFIAFGKNADFVSNYLKKGTKIAIESHVQTGNYTNKEGQKVYTTDFVIDSIEFCESKSNSNVGNAYPSDDVPTMNEAPTPPPAPNDSFMNIPLDAAEELPFR